MGQRAIQAKQKAAARKSLDATSAQRGRRKKQPDARALAQKFAIDIARLIADDKCSDVVVLDLHELSAVCDFFVIGTGTSDRQMRAAAAHVDDLARQRGEKLFTTAGEDAAAWMIYDYVDVVVHLFSAESRAFYDLENLWGEAKRVDWQP